MTTHEADKIIARGEPVTVRSRDFDEEITARFTRRDRWSIYSAAGGVFDRGDLEISRKP